MWPLWGHCDAIGGHLSIHMVYATRARKNRSSAQLREQNRQGWTYPCLTQTGVSRTWHFAFWTFQRRHRKNRRRGNFNRSFGFATTLASITRSNRFGMRIRSSICWPTPQHPCQITPFGAHLLILTSTQPPTWTWYENIKTTEPQTVPTRVCRPHAPLVSGNAVQLVQLAYNLLGKYVQLVQFVQLRAYTGICLHKLYGVGRNMKTSKPLSPKRYIDKMLHHLVSSRKQADFAMDVRFHPPIPRS